MVAVYKPDPAVLQGQLNDLVTNVKRYGALGNGVADDSAAIIAAILACYNAGGGVVYFPPGTYRCDSQLAVPNDGHAPSPRQPAITLRGAGAIWDGSWQTNGVVPATTTLDLRSTTAPAKIDTRGSGALTIEQLTITQTTNAADTNPFIQTTNTTLFVRDCSFFGHTSLSKGTCIQDVIVLGGTTTVVDGTAAGAFQGYGTVIRENYFARIRRGVYGRVYCNAVGIVKNTWSNSCGSDNTAAAVQFDGTTGAPSSGKGNNLIGNTFEVGGYVYAVRLTNAGYTTSFANSFWDNVGGFLACYLIEGAAANCAGNVFRDIFNGPAFAQWVIVNTTGGTQTYSVEGGPTRLGLSLFAGGDLKTLVQSAVATGSETANLFAVKRSAAEGVSPDTYIFQVQQNGGVFISGANAGLAIGGVTYDGTSVVKASGNLNLYGGSGATDKVTISRGILQADTAVQCGFAAPTYSASITPNAYNGNWQRITVTDGNAFTINAPINPPNSSHNQELTIEIVNSSGGVMGVITWDGAFVFAGVTWANPASTKKRFARFEWNGAAWICTGFSTADY